MNVDLKNKINNSGLKKKYIAKQIGVNPSVLSMWLRGERFPSIEKEKLLKNMLEIAS